MRGRVLWTATVLTVMLTLPAVAAAQVLSEAATDLARDGIYVADGARDALSTAQVRDLRERIRSADVGPVYVAVLDDSVADEAGGSARGAAQQLLNQVGRDGTYAFIIGTELFATSNLIPGVPEIADETAAENRQASVSEVLTDFVDRVDEAADGGGSPEAARDGASGLGLLPLLLFGGFALLAIRGLSRRSGRSRLRQAREPTPEQLQEVRQVAHDDLVALGEDLRALDLDVEMPGADPRAKRDYVRALDCYQRASANLDRARHPDELQAVSEALEEGRYAMAAAKALLDGREPPERRPPCFFDPRHGPSVRDVEYEPDFGSPRMVPACAADAQRVEDGERPHAREVLVGGQATPYWNAPGYYGPWMGGYYGGFGGGLLPGLLVGSMLGSGWGLGPWVGGGLAGADSGGGFGGGDFGGGDFGGGDFGGGDFGGGDFGGGDFG